jgi:hypothetical protein
VETPGVRHRAGPTDMGVMKFHRELSSALTFACVGVGLASPALADPPAPGIWQGTYTYAGPAVASGPGITRTWIATSCGTGCAQIQVSPVAGQGGFSAEAQLGYGGWALTHQNVPDAVVCNDGHRGVGNITYRWGGTEGTISGTANSWVRDVPTCSDTTKTPSFSFTLTKVS